MLEGWQRAGRWIRAARTRAGLKPHQFAEATGVSERTLWSLEVGERDTFDEETLDAIQRGLGWPPGSIRGMADGTLTPFFDEQLRRVIDLWLLLDTDTRTLVADLIERLSDPPADPPSDNA